MRSAVGQNFSTSDQDNDSWDGTPACTELWHGAWWYKDCCDANLNGRYIVKGPDGIGWYTFHPRVFHRLRFTEMKLRPY